jgi:hypothetical protein
VFKDNQLQAIEIEIGFAEKPLYGGHRRRSGARHGIDRREKIDLEPFRFETLSLSA